VYLKINETLKYTHTRARTHFFYYLAILNYIKSAIIVLTDQISINVTLSNYWTLLQSLIFNMSAWNLHKILYFGQKWQIYNMSLKKMWRHYS